MPPGELFERKCEAGQEFEVVMLFPDDVGLAKKALRERDVCVNDEGALGHFTIRVDDPTQWADIGSVVFGEIHPLKQPDSSNS